METPEDRKKVARKLIKNYHRDNPANVTYTPAKTLSFARWAIQFDDLIVHFQDDGKRLWYLGEYPQ